ncbi:MAG: ABC transporter substrate-binding protein [Candidatus Marithrix sp.]|nr:ABC transporter substrate-binding protein [Candidatus Marithrix sp.]
MFRLIFFILIIFLTACDLIPGLNDDDDTNINNKNIANVQLTFAVAPQIAWIPWYLANEQGIFNQFSNNINIKFVSDNYQKTIDSFLNNEVHAIAISNIDAIAQIVRHDIEVDVILITNGHSGSEAILLPQDVDANINNLRDKSFAMTEFSTSHYLFERYLIRNQIDFDEISIFNTSNNDIINAFTNNKEIIGVVAQNPQLHHLVNTADAKIIFDSKQISNEIFDLIVMRRETLIDYPEFAQVLLSSWFTITQRLQGNKKGPTLSILSDFVELTPEQYAEQLTTTPLNDTPAKALAKIRSRSIRKTMRHIQYFIERHRIASEESFTDWVSYPGRNPAILHFNGQPLQRFIAPSVKE